MKTKLPFAKALAIKMALKHDLAYKTRVKLEITINTLLGYGLTPRQTQDTIEDIFGNLYFINYAPMLQLPKK